MEEEKIVTEEQQEEEVTLETVQMAILRQIGNGLTDDEIEPTLEAFNAVSRALADERKAANEEARIKAETERSIRETEAAEAKSKRETEMAEEKSKREAEASAERAKSDLIGRVVTAAGQIGAAVIAGAVSIFTVGVILDEEKHDRLIRSAAWRHLFKPRG